MKNKFFVIFKKELKDLITVQTLFPLVLIFVLFYFLGNMMPSLISDDTVTIQSEQTDQSGQTSEVEITVSKNSMIGFIDYDKSELSDYIYVNLPTRGITPIIPKSSNPEEAMTELETYNLNGEEIKIQSLIVIPEGLDAKLRAGEYVSIDAYSSIDSFGLTSMIAGASAQTAIGSINSVLTRELFDLYGGDPSIDINYINYPVYSNDYTYLNSKTEKVNATMVLSYVSSQTMFIPIIIMLILMMASQMIAGSIVNEKTDKTLETLMTAPMNRMSVLLAKVLAAAIYAIIYAVVFSISNNNFMGSMAGGDIYPEGFAATLETFGITFNITTLAIVGVQLFLSVLCGLAISLLIGMMIEDIKSLQAYLIPIIFAVMIPYFLSMFLDINTLPLIAKILVYAIPFTHTYTAFTNIFVQNYTLLIFGAIYQAIFVAILLTVAVRIFNSDKLFTLGQIMKKKPGKKNGSFSIGKWRIG
ncbi:MAG: ABC transporter permease [Oscillospiraceae bacterium]|nr:ABC transporter permease [Oscillospiraceae bacterium]